VKKILVRILFCFKNIYYYHCALQTDPAFNLEMMSIYVMSFQNEKVVLLSLYQGGCNVQETIKQHLENDLNYIKKL